MFYLLLPETLLKGHFFLPVFQGGKSAPKCAFTCPISRNHKWKRPGPRRASLYLFTLLSQGDCRKQNKLPQGTAETLLGFLPEAPSLQVAS